MSNFLRAYPPAQPASGPAFWLPFRGSDLVVKILEGDKIGLGQISPEEMQEVLQPTSTPLYLGTLNELPLMTCELDKEAVLPEGWKAVGLRGLYGQLDETAYGLSGYASQMLYWQRTSNFCPVCGHQPEQNKGDWGKRCPNCGHIAYPHVTPAVLALVHDGGDQILLTHKPGWAKMYSLIAGFVEPGESLEECVHREVLEEAGLSLEAPVYKGSQSWPFPHQLMLGFWARYAGGEIKLDEAELDDAKWFHVDDLPPMPPRLSLSRQLIDSWVESRRPART
jgi:NAD+ diphosphatase